MAAKTAADKKVAALEERIGVLEEIIRIRLGISIEGFKAERER